GASFTFYSYRGQCHLRSYPTRRSSDLLVLNGNRIGIGRTGGGGSGIPHFADRIVVETVVAVYRIIVCRIRALRAAVVAFRVFAPYVDGVVYHISRDVGSHVNRNCQRDRAVRRYRIGNRQREGTVRTDCTHRAVI